MNEASDVTKALAAFGAPSIRYHSFGAGQVRPSSVVLPRRVGPRPPSPPPPSPPPPSLPPVSAPPAELRQAEPGAAPEPMPPQPELPEPPPQFVTPVAEQPVPEFIPPPPALAEQPAPEFIPTPPPVAASVVPPPIQEPVASPQPVALQEAEPRAARHLVATLTQPALSSSFQQQPAASPLRRGPPQGQSLQELFAFLAGVPAVEGPRN